MKKFKTHRERKECCCADYECDCTKPTIRRVRIQELDKRTNRMKTRVEMQTIDRVEEMKPFKVSDFCIENLTAIGAQLNPTHMTASPHKAITDMSRTLSNIEIPTEGE